MSPTIRAFLDTSALFAATVSIEGGAYKMLALGATQAIQLLVSPDVLQEIEGALHRKAPKNLGILAALLDHSRIEVASVADAGTVEKSNELIGYMADAQVFAAAWASGADYFVTLDRQHFLDNVELRNAVPFPLGTPGDFLAWFRERVMAEGHSG